MKIRLLKAAMVVVDGAYVVRPAGAEVEVSEESGKDLVARGAAEAAKDVPAGKADADGKKAAARLSGSKKVKG